MAARKAEPASPPAVVEPDSGTVRHVRSADGLNLAVRIFDAPGSERLPLMCLPGFSRNSRDFLALARRESRHPEGGRRVFALDYRGRGLSDSDPDWGNYTPLVEAQDVLAVAVAFGIEHAIVVGTSRGGIIAMILAALRPSLFAGLALNDIGPAIEAIGLARIKSSLAHRRVFAAWDDAIAATKETAGAQFPRLAQEDWEAFTRAFYVESSGGIAPQFDRHLLHTLDDLDVTAKIPSLWPQFEALASVPMLAIRGERSDLLSVATLAEMQRRQPALETVTVAGEGHAPLLRDSATLARLRTFFDRCDRGAH